MIGFLLLSLAAGLAVFSSVRSGLPQITNLKDYRPLLVSQVFDRNGKKVGEFFRERRLLIPYNEIPKDLILAFLAAEDDQFFEHSGINYSAILRATFANLRAGRNVQGGSTITQQVAKTLLSTEKTYTRKIREALLAKQIEDVLTKEEILYLYLNQIYFGQGAYGVRAAAETYFRKKVKDLKLSEMAILAGLPQAPTRYSPVHNPVRAKERQKYVLKRMAEVGFVKEETAKAAREEPIKVFVRENFEAYAPFYLETVRQLLVEKIGESALLDQGVKIQLSLDIDKQIAANKAVRKGLKELDKRQGFRGAEKNLTSKEEIDKFLAETKKNHVLKVSAERTILPSGNFEELYVPMRFVRQKKQGGKELQPKPAAMGPLPPYLKIGDEINALVLEVNDSKNYTLVQGPDFKGVIPFSSMKWARKPNPEKVWEQDLIKRPSEALKKGDVIQVRIVSNSLKTLKIDKAPAELLGLAELELEQEPLAEGALVSFDQKTEDVLAMVGGYDFQRNEYNRALQAARQTGSSFKSIVYLAALEKGYNPSTPIMDAPIVYEQREIDEGQEQTTLWRPANHGRSYAGDITFRNSLVQSLNIPTVKIIEDISVPFAIDFAHRLGIFSKLNPDFTLALGSSSVTLYEMTKVFSIIGRLGKKTNPVLILSVVDSKGKKLLENISLDEKFKVELSGLNQPFEERRKNFLAAREKIQSAESENQEDSAGSLANSLTKTKDSWFFFQDEDQLIRPQSAYIMTSLLRGAVEDPRGTGGRARALGREVAGKTGTTNGYIDTWFMGYTPQVATGVWVGYDRERSLGRGEVGGRAALPIWVDYMLPAHQNLPQLSFPVPSNIVFLNIDRDSGKLATSRSKNIIRQAFIEGTEPSNTKNSEDETTDFLKQDLSE
jgi:penicillin-binding protein 1A